MKRLAIIGAIVALAAWPLAGCGGEDEAQAKGPIGCNPGQWATVIVKEPNGDIDTSIVKAVLPEGTYVEGTGSGSAQTRIYWDGRVEASGGEVTVECASPTH